MYRSAAGRHGRSRRLWATCRCVGPLASRGPLGPGMAFYRVGEAIIEVVASGVDDGGSAEKYLAAVGLTQAGPIVGDLGLSREQRTQLAFLLCNENADDLSAQFRHTHPARIGDAFESHHR